MREVENLIHAAFGQHTICAVWFESTTSSETLRWCLIQFNIENDGLSPFKALICVLMLTARERNLVDLIYGDKSINGQANWTRESPTNHKLNDQTTERW